MAASPRDCILASTSHETLDRLPMDHWGTGKVTGMLYRRLGCGDALERYERLGIGGIVGVGSPYIGLPLTKYFEIPEDVPENWRASVPIVFQTLQDLG